MITNALLKNVAYDIICSITSYLEKFREWINIILDLINNISFSLLTKVIVNDKVILIDESYCYW